MTTALDANILLDLLIPDNPELQNAQERLGNALEAGPIVICEIVYAEISARFRSEDEIDRFLQETGVRLARCQPGTLFRAGLAWTAYLRQRSNQLQCARCGQLEDVQCQRCGSALRARQHLVADFLIGAHAAMQADRLLTRDRGYYGTYFPELRLA